MILDIKNLSFSYGSKYIFKDINFRLESKDTLSILGPNGIGKTTLIKCILGFKKKTNGEILINNKDIEEYDKKGFYSFVAYLKQGGKETSIYTVLDTVLLGLASKINPLLKPKDDDIEKAESLLKELGIYKLRDNYVSKLSGGEAQMVFMARALIREPEILILDEPESNLDYRNQLMMLDMINKLKDKGKIVIFNTHYPEHALRYSDKVLLLNENFKYKFGSTIDIINKENIEETYKIKAAVGDLTDGKNIYKDIIPISIA